MSLNRFRDRDVRSDRHPERVAHFLQDFENLITAKGLKAAILIVARLEDQLYANLFGDRLYGLGHHHGLIARLNCAGAADICQGVLAANFHRGVVTIPNSDCARVIHYGSPRSGPFIDHLEYRAASACSYALSPVECHHIRLTHLELRLTRAWLIHFSPPLAVCRVPSFHHPAASDVVNNFATQKNSSKHIALEGHLTMNVLDALLSLSRPQKRMIQVAIDCVAITGCYALAMWLRLDSWSFAYNPETWYVLLWVGPVSLGVFIRSGLYRAVLRYVGFQAVYAVALGVVASAFTMFVVSQFFGWFVPRSVPIIYTFLAFVAIGFSRLFWRTAYAQFHAPKRAAVAVYGAGHVGRQAVASLTSGQEYAPVLFLDDTPNLKGTTIQGLRVYPTDDLEKMISLYDIEVVLLASPEMSRAKRKTILSQLESLRVKVQTVPDMADLVSGRASIEDIRSVPIEDLLGRDPVPPRPELMRADVSGKSVLVTGAGGSIGSELCRQLLPLSPKRLVLLEQSEFNLYQVEQELAAQLARESHSVTIESVLGSIQHPRRIEALLNRFEVETIYHAAAYKHVPLVEANLPEGIRNNVVGMMNLANAAIAANVTACILISTDKAVRPTNVMGATKRLAELICQALAAEQSGTRFSMVRFGNVLGSSGSVIPRFRSQISAGGPVTVTVREMTRYFMTIPEAAQLVIQAGAMAKGGDVFVLDMGEAISILDLARRMVRLSGLTPWIKGEDDPADIEIVFSGLRPGEKLYEELLIGDEDKATDHPRIRSATELSLPWSELRLLLKKLEAAARDQDSDNIREILIGASIGYQPNPADWAGVEPPKNVSLTARHRS